MDVWPAINDPVILRDAAGREYRSRVEDLGPDRLVVARPHDLPADEVFGPDTGVEVTWPTGRGIGVLPTRIVEAHSEGSLRLWSLAVTGEARVEQRRRFVRVPARGPVTLRLEGAEDQADGEEGAATVIADLLEVSEAALRCAVDAAVAERIGAGGVAVTASFRFGDGHFAIPGHVDARRPSARPTEVVELVVRFDEPVADADALRKEAFGQQVRTPRAREGR
jgi:hypothetical protein